MTEMEDAIDCPVCYDRFDTDSKMPRQLPCCGAVVCSRCLVEMMDDELCCPECFAMTTIDDPDAFVETLEAPQRILQALGDVTPTSVLSFDSDGRTTENPDSRSSTPRGSLTAFLQQALSDDDEIDESDHDEIHEESVEPEFLNETRQRWADRARSISGLTAFGRISEVTLASDETIAPETVRQLFQEEKQLPLAETLALLKAARDLFEEETNVLHLDAPLLCVGDLHGQYDDLLTVLHGSGCNGTMLSARRQVRTPRYFLQSSSLQSKYRVRSKPEAPTTRHQHHQQQPKKKAGSVLFLGDYVDRGPRGCEVLLYLLALKVRYPTKVHLIRGNHESRSLTGHFGFRSECRRKYGMSAYHEICRVFEALPLAAKVRGGQYGDVLCCHGGIGPSFETIADLNDIDRFQEPPEDGPLCDVLWADPGRRRGDDEEDEEEAPLFETNAARGCSYVFSKEATARFLKKNNLAAIVRAHEVQEDGFANDFVDLVRKNHAIAPVTTVFSAPNYCGKYGNDAAVLVLGTERAEAVVFDAQPSKESPVVETDLDGAEMESDAVRRAYEICPYMPSSFRAIVDCAHELLDEDLVRKVAVAEKKKGLSPPRRASTGSLVAVAPPPKRETTMVMKAVAAFSATSRSKTAPVATVKPEKKFVMKAVAAFSSNLAPKTVKEPPPPPETTTKNGSVAALRARFETSRTPPPETTPPRRRSWGAASHRGKSTPPSLDTKPPLRSWGGLFKTTESSEVTIAAAVPVPVPRPSHISIKTTPPRGIKVERPMMTQLFAALEEQKKPGRTSSPKTSAKSRRFSAAQNGDAFNEMAPSAVVRRVRRTTCPQLAAILAKTSFVDSGNVKNTILDAQRVRVTDVNELREFRSELIKARRATSGNNAGYLRAAKSFGRPLGGPLPDSSPPETRKRGLSDPVKNVDDPPPPRGGGDEDDPRRVATVVEPPTTTTTKPRIEEEEEEDLTVRFCRSEELPRPSLTESVSDQPPTTRSPPLRRVKSDLSGATETKEGFSDQEIYALRLIFSLFDIDGSGSIDSDELAKYADEVNECVSPRDVDRCIDALDTDGDKCVTLNDWLVFAAKLKVAWEMQEAALDFLPHDDDNIGTGDDEGLEEASETDTTGGK